MPQQEEQHRHHVAASAAAVHGHSSLSPSSGATAAMGSHAGALPHVVASSSLSKIHGTGAGGVTEAAAGGASHGRQNQRRPSASGRTHAGGGSRSKGGKASSSSAERPTAAGIVIGGGNKHRRPSAPPPQPPATKDRREREPDEAEYYWLGVQAAMAMDAATLEAEVKEFIMSKGVEDQRRQEAEEAVEKKPFSFCLADEEAEADLMKISRWAEEVDRRRAAEDADASKKRCRRRRH
ncbi:hypothetical protein BS78_06G065300 [Paspalum vaginatum]|nr:hypothetical protein BS78_06G065300 [Paspalum vaginatum]